MKQPKPNPVADAILRVARAKVALDQAKRALQVLTTAAVVLLSVGCGDAHVDIPESYTCRVSAFCTSPVRHSEWIEWEEPSLPPGWIGPSKEQDSAQYLAHIAYQEQWGMCAVPIRFERECQVDGEW